jgi:hypothetical protein
MGRVHALRAVTPVQNVRTWRDTAVGPLECQAWIGALAHAYR